MTEPPVLTIELLEALRMRWEAQNAPLTKRLRRGLSNELIDEATKPLNLQLPTEARVWWGWHDGAEAVSDDPGASELGPDRAFTPLHRAVSQYYERRSIAVDTDPDDAERYWGEAWFPLTAFGDVACDCSVAEGEPTPIRFTNYHYTQTPDVPVAASLAQLVTWWIDAIDQGAWYYDARRRRWSVNVSFLDPEREKTGLI